VGRIIYGGTVSARKLVRNPDFSNAMNLQGFIDVSEAQDI
jgi:hypothetical protein